MGKSITRLTILVPGTKTSERAWGKALEHGGLSIKNGTLHGLAAKPDVEWIENDGHFGEAFSFGTVADDLVETIDRAPGALVLHWPVDLREGREAIVRAVERLREAGALAVRVEQSKLGWEVSNWLRLISSINPWDWHRTVVVFLGDEEEVQSCGMHAFSLPDASLRSEGHRDAMQALASALNVYQLAEDPVIVSGQTFTPDQQTPRRVVQRWPDTQYPADHACHNPFGVWRLSASGGTAPGASRLATVFMPPLVSVLAASEKRARKALTEVDVLTIRDEAVCMAMEHREAQMLERSRGYADIDPEFAWEQWQLVRRTGV